MLKSKPLKLCNLEDEEGSPTTEGIPLAAIANEVSTDENTGNADTDVKDEAGTPDGDVTLEEGDVTDEGELDETQGEGDETEGEDTFEEIEPMTDGEFEPETDDEMDETDDIVIKNPNTSESPGSKRTAAIRSRLTPLKTVLSGSLRSSSSRRSSKHASPKGRELPSPTASNGSRTKQIPIVVLPTLAEDVNEKLLSISGSRTDMSQGRRSNSLSPPIDEHHVSIPPNPEKSRSHLHLPLDSSPMHSILHVHSPLGSKQVTPEHSTLEAGSIHGTEGIRGTPRMGSSNEMQKDDDCYQDDHDISHIEVHLHETKGTPLGKIRSRLNSIVDTVVGSTSASRPASRRQSAVGSRPGSRGPSAVGSRPGSRGPSAVGSRPGSRVASQGDEEGQLETGTDALNEEEADLVHKTEGGDEAIEKQVPAKEGEKTEPKAPPLDGAGK